MTSLFDVDEICQILSFLRSGGRLLAFAYRFGDSFTRTYLRDLFSPLGCLLNDDAIINLHMVRGTYPLQSHFDTESYLLPLAWSLAGVSAVRWRAMATFTILPDAQVRPLALSPGGHCISFNRVHRRISFESLPIAVAGQHGQGRFLLFGGPHAFETGPFGLLDFGDNARFVENALRWLMDDNPETGISHASPQIPWTTNGTGHDGQGLSLVECKSADQRTVAYVERLFRQTGVLKALNRAKWMT